MPNLRFALAVVRRLVRSVVTRMVTYTIIPKVDETGFHVAIVGGDGTRQTLLGFETQADAQACIAWDKRQSSAGFGRSWRSDGR